MSIDDSRKMAVIDHELKKLNIDTGRSSSVWAWPVTCFRTRRPDGADRRSRAEKQPTSVGTVEWNRGSRFDHSSVSTPR
ncbi:hypothetical protein F2P81_010944 [Scophthalmus maximus]|uniref:Uncharacterized protein n=1 Tax=Scophthalmus maximus TaxID=52904 RepID=A0A6A4T060_SCOMX|nr:hypothetical protein F2P81_010944 [Scophthalmus maximus]